MFYVRVRSVVMENAMQQDHAAFRYQHVTVTFRCGQKTNCNVRRRKTRLALTVLRAHVMYRPNGPELYRVVHRNPQQREERVEASVRNHLAVGDFPLRYHVALRHGTGITPGPSEISITYQFR